MTISNILIFLFSGLLGYLVGRFGDNYLNFWIGDPWWAPHHWIYGLILVLVGIFAFDGYWGLLLISFGAGHWISDFKDYLDMRIFGSDNKGKEKVKFWDID